jgi:flavodoxin I
MFHIGIFYGSSTGNTDAAANEIADTLQTLANCSVDLFEISKKNVGKIAEYDKLIFGVPTWDIGQLQEDWENVLPLLEELDLTGKQVALFGCGDQYGYPDTYQDAIGILGRSCAERGAILVGYWPTDGYEFDESLALHDGLFMGLALDDNQRELTSPRIQQWVQQLIQEFDLVAAEVA